MLKFEITEEELRKINTWMEQQDQTLLEQGKDEMYLQGGAIGGRFTYEFTPTGLGVILKVTDGLTKETLDLTDYDNW